MVVTRWPSRRIALPAVRRWIEAVADAPVSARPEILRSKSWGVTARFRAGDRDVVFKASFTPLFPAAPAVEAVLARAAPKYVAPFVAHDVDDDYIWLLYESVAGETLERLYDAPRLALL